MLKISTRKRNIVLFLMGGIILYFACISHSFAYTLFNPKVETIYNSFVTKVKKKYSDEKEIDFFNKLDQALENILKNKSLPIAKEGLIKDLLYLNKIQIDKYSISTDISNNITHSEENEKIFQEILNQNSNKKIIDSYSVVKEFKNKSYNIDHIFLENGVWYTYIFTSHVHFDDNNFSNASLKHNNINAKNDLLFLKENGLIGFVKEGDYEKVKLISNDILLNTSNKYQFLLEIKDDKRYINNETDQVFKNLKEITLQLTSGLSNEEKIKEIYHYILNRTHYSENIDFSNLESINNQQIFSGIETFRNENGVCGGYSKFFTYMLSFAGVGEVEAIRGLVIDAPDFPNIGHAWVKIGDKYYDPTFDDPVGQKETKTYEKYKFFGLPKDLFYTNRYTYDDIPEYLKTETIEYRKNFINEKLSKLTQKYQNSDFLLLQPFKFREKYNISFDEAITVEKLSQVTPIYEVSNFQFTQDGVLKSFKTLKFFTIKEDNIEGLLEQLGYNLDGYYLFKWQLEGESYEYRLGYDIVFR